MSKVDRNHVQHGQGTRRRGRRKARSIERASRYLFHEIANDGNVQKMVTLLACVTFSIRSLVIKYNFTSVCTIILSRERPVDNGA